MTDQRDYNRRMIEDFRANRSKSDGPFAGRPLLLLTTAGAKSRLRRTPPMMYVPDGDRLLVIASNIVAPTHPHWYRILVAHPDVRTDASNLIRFAPGTYFLTAPDGFFFHSFSRSPNL